MRQHHRSAGGDLRLQQPGGFDVGFATLCHTCDGRSFLYLLDTTALTECEPAPTCFVVLKPGALDIATGKLPVMAEPDDLETRVGALETQVREPAERVRHSEQDAAAARVLAGGADRDVTEIRGEIRDFRQATTSSFNAMREDLTDLLQHVDNGFTEMRGKLDAAAAGQQQIVDLLTTLIGQKDNQ